MPTFPDCLKAAALAFAAVGIPAGAQTLAYLIGG